MWWVVGVISVLIASIMFKLCISAGKADRTLEYINVRDLNLHNKDNN